MIPRTCEECGKPIEYPYPPTVGIVPLPNGQEREMPFCQDCLDNLEWQSKQSAASKRGEACALCLEPLDRGGTTLEVAEGFPGDAKFLRVCQACAEHAEQVKRDLRG